MKSKDLKVIKGIQAEAWGKFGSKLFIEEEKAGTVRKVIDLALTEQRDKFTPAQISKLENIKDSGMLEGTHKVEDPKVAKEMETFVEKRIAEEIKAGRLTKPEDVKKKSKQYANRKKRELLKDINKVKNG